MAGRDLVRRAAKVSAGMVPARGRGFLYRRLGPRLGLAGSEAGLVSMVVVCEPVDHPRLSDSVTSLLDQAHGFLEVLICPIEPAPAQRWGDPRVRVLPTSDTWYDAANRGADRAQGAFLGFVRGCDLLPRDAVGRLAEALSGSGSAMASGRLVQRGQGEQWLERAQAMVHRECGTALPVSDREDLAGDLVIGNRLWRTDAWRDGGHRFTADDDWLVSPTVAVALARTEQVDVHAAATYEYLPAHGTRSFGATPSPLPELTSWRRQAELVERALAGSPLLDGWLHHVLDVGLPRFVKDTERATDDQWRALVAVTAAYLRRARVGLLADVRAESRALLWLTEQGRRGDVEALADEALGLGDDLRTGPGLLAVWSTLPADVPDAMRRLAVGETPLVAEVQRVRAVEGGRDVDLFLRIDHLDLATAEPAVEISLQEGEQLPVTRLRNPAATRWAGRRFQSVDTGAVRVRVPGTEPVITCLRMTVGDVSRAGRVAIPRLDETAVGAPAVCGLALEGTELVVTRDGDPGELRLVDPDGGPAGPPATVRDGKAVFPLRDESFGRSRWLPPAGYRLVTGGGAVVLAPELRQSLPLDQVGERHRMRVLVGPHGGLQVRLGPPLRDDELGPYAQEQLQTAYAAAEAPTDPDLFYFESYVGRSATDSPLAIFTELRRRRPDLRAYWGIADHSQAVPEGATAVLLRSRAWYDVLAAAGCLVVNTEFDTWYRRRPDQFVLQTFHGHPSKAMGEMQWRSNQLSPSRIRMMRSRSVETWDAILTPSPEMTRHYREQYGYEGPALEHGYPRDDDLRSPDTGRQRGQIRRLLGIREDQTAVLYAPTWREHLAFRPRAAAMADFLDVGAAAAALGPGHVLLLRGHRFHTPRGAGARVIDVTGYPEINDLILASDVAVLDYSSLRFDYAQTGKPMVFLVPDLDEYDGGLRGFLFPFADSAPGPFVTDTAGVVAEVRDVAGLGERYADQLAAFDATYNAWQDGHAAERVVDGLLGLLRERAEPRV